LFTRDFHIHGVASGTRANDLADNDSARCSIGCSGALIQVFTQKHREESKGSDFLYLHFTGDRLAFGFLICALTSGGLMAGWQLS
jgi:hypothetical protein